MRERGKRVLREEAEAILSLAERLGPSFDKAVEAILRCEGRVVVTGIGKSGSIARKIASTFASTGTPALFLHPAEAHHGDFGMLVKGDVLLAISKSGKTNEVLSMIPYAKAVGVPVIAMVGDLKSRLAELADIVLDCTVPREADSLNLTPTTSSTATLALGDALAVTVMDRRQFTPRDFVHFHPGGELGRKLLRVSDIMRTGESNPVVSTEATVAEALRVMTVAGSAGVVSVVDSTGRLVGLFTDGDLRRHLMRTPDLLQRKVGEVMTPSPTSIESYRLATEALRILHENKWDNLPVVDDDGRPIGMLDVQDLLNVKIL